MELEAAEEILGVKSAEILFVHRVRKRGRILQRLWTSGATSSCDSASQAFSCDQDGQRALLNGSGR
jgi:hypothetical protein